MIGAIEGYAVAGGMELALMCDLRVVAEDTVMGIFNRRFGKVLASFLGGGLPCGKVGILVVSLSGVNQSFFGLAWDVQDKMVLFLMVNVSFRVALGVFL